MPSETFHEAATSFGRPVLFGFRLSKTGLSAHKPHKPPSFDDWQQLGEYLRWMEGAIHWLIGDWVRYGEQHFHERASQAVDATGWALDTVKQTAWVAERVHPERRDPDLSYSHHREIADLPPTDQSRWLKRAKRDGLSVEKLRRAIHTEQAPTNTECWLVVSCKDESDRETLRARLQAEGRSVKLP